jgi:hypothetical protein
MSDISDGFVPSDAEGGAPEGIDVVDTPTDVSSSTEAPQYEQEPAEASPVYTVGDQQVTLDELQKGYLRQSDYTRKTQDLAEQKQRLARAEAIAAALEVDPEATLKALSEAYGQSLQAASVDNQEDLDPQERRLRAMEQQYETWQETQRQAQIESELTQLRSTYGDFDETALLTHAISKGIGDLGAAYRDMTYEQVWSQAQAREHAAQQEADADAQVTDAKRQAGIVEGGTSRQAGVVGAGPAKVGSVREAFLAAKQLLGQ